MRVQGSGPQQVSDVFDVGGPAPLAGATLGLAFFSTPDASIAGQSANPLVGAETTALPERDVTRRVLARAGVSDAETIEWLDGPRPIDPDAPALSMELLGTRTGMESFQGVVSGEDGPWRVGIHAGRITDDSHVIAAGVHR